MRDSFKSSGLWLIVTDGMGASADVGRIEALTPSLHSPASSPLECQSTNPEEARGGVLWLLSMICIANFSSQAMN